MGVRASLHNAVTACVTGVLGVFAPQTALRYAAARNVLMAYDAARRDGPNGGWNPRDGNADHLIARDRKLVQARARHLAINSPNIAGALRKICDNVVFTGIMPQAQLRTNDGARDRIRNDRVEADFRAWAEEVDLHETQRLAVRHLWQDGGYLLHYTFSQRLLDAGLIPLRPVMLDLDRLAREVHGELGNGNIALWGQEFNASGERVAFHVRRCDPLSAVSMRYETVRIPAEWCRMVMVRDRIGQTQPMSWLASIIMTMHDFTEYQTSERIAARLAAAFGVFIKLPDTTLGGGNGLDGNPLGGTLGTLAGGKGTDGSTITPRKFIESGRIDVLPPGADIAVAKSDRPGLTYEPFTRTSLRNASAGVGMSAEAFSNDYSQASYSSARSASLEERRGYRVQQHLLNVHHNGPIWSMWCLMRHAFGFGSETGGRVIPVRWQTPGWQWVDPAKDAQAAETRLRLGLTTRRDLCAEAGVDFDEILEGLAEEHSLMIERGIDPAPWAAAQPTIDDNKDDDRNDRSDDDA